MPLDLNRRQALAGAGALVALAAAGGLTTGPALAANDAMAKLMEFTGGVEPTRGRVLLDMPEIAENGNTVPMNVSVESPMTDEDHVQRLLILADGNPSPGVATFHFSPMAGVAQANTRIRLGGTQNVMAVAQMSDGSFFMDVREVKVTIGGCGG
jgi:sulfur-oxidizing protein SoxY